MTTNIPYTYLIGWSNNKKFYYGVRYSKNCHPSDLFISYFTSSKHVKHYIKKYGNPDIIQVRKTFKTINEAIAWENRVLQKINAKQNKNFLNASNNAAPPPSIFDRAKNFENWLKLPYDQRYSSEAKKRISESSRRSITLRHAEGKITYKKPEDTTNYKIAAAKRWSDSAFKEKAKSRKWYHNEKTKECKMLLPEQVTSNWTLGRKHFN
jgi:DNA primase large subunit